VFHPNVDPDSAFVCLWDRFSAGDTAAQGLYQFAGARTGQIGARIDF
jgi:hypothetical protein